MPAAGLCILAAAVFSEEIADTIEDFAVIGNETEASEPVKLSFVIYIEDSLIYPADIGVSEDSTAKPVIIEFLFALKV